ncbi:hypothetical protein ACJJIE_04525 [Microbulbifer sp. TRSA001]|uniref:hypothetical protein n=1 Tax=unclassified Microbulbifer TaxID=2619833 RepID=UPI0024AE1800|nr:hypothetical protein [Microbulbifer sp. VAAF005]WHI46933.1 hypothetical protein P0078_00745 [Microbulbifer sp. VAAF005]
MKIKLSDEEVSTLSAATKQLVVKKRTGEVGILHGMNRFVSAQVVLKKKDREALYSAFKKLGMAGFPKEVDM